MVVSVVNDRSRIVLPAAVVVKNPRTRVCKPAALLVRRWLSVPQRKMIMMMMIIIK